ncbi:hypothetical protein ACFVXW_25360 [Streptomyces sp. NPDC058251]|uniref:hypothetical protein n=1 Tax=Streptomyces sp. NPDC058251 TaxID=3346404 RepID=UPI0036E7CC2F
MAENQTEAWKTVYAAAQRANDFGAFLMLMADAGLSVAAEKEAGTLHCYRCGRKYRLNERDQLVDAGAGKLKCDPKGPLYDACMSTYNTV